MQAIKEELDLGDQKKAFKGKTIKIKKLVKKDNGSFTLKDTYIAGDDTVNDSAIEKDAEENHNNGDSSQENNYNMFQTFDSQVQNSGLANYNFSKQEKREIKEVRM